MTVSNSVYIGAANSARRTTVMDVVREPREESYQVPNPDVSDADRVNATVLDVAESETFNYGVMGATALGSAGVAAAGAAGGGVTAAGVAAAASLGTFAVAAGAGLAGGYLGSMAGEAAADFVFGSLMGKKKVATEGDVPARMGDPIAHINKNAGLWGAIVGAVAAVAIVAVAVATCGAGLVVLAAAAAVAGAAAGGIASFASTAGQYGANKGTITQGSSNVFFEGQPVARVGDLIACSDHPGPMVLAEGAKTVYANNKNIVRVGHRTSCDGNVNDGCTTIVQTTETAVVFEIKDSRSPALRWANVIVNLLPLPRNKGPGGKPRPNTRTTSNRGKGCGTNKCDGVGEPVDAGTGDFLQVWPVLDLPGTLPLRLTRTYRSSAGFRGLFGAKWADDWSQRLELGPETVTFHTAEGTTLEYHTPDDEVQALNLREARYCLFGRRSKVLRLYDRQTRTVLSFAQANGAIRRLSDIEDLNGNRIRFEYQDNLLCRIQHSDGFALAVDCLPGADGARLRSLRAVSAPLNRTDLIRCEYHSGGYLTHCASHQFGALFHNYDDRGRMTQWRDTDQTRAEIDYDKQGRVLATRTGSGHYNDRFEYDDDAGCTHYFDAEGSHSRFYYNADGLVTRTIDALGHEWLTEWDDNTNKRSATDPLGRTTRFDYNDYNELIRITAPDGATQTFDYDTNGALCSATRPDGACWQLHHDPRGNLVRVHAPDGRRTGFRLGPRGEVLRREEPDGSQWRYAYDHHLRLSEIIAPDGARTRVRLDLFGRVLETVDALSHITRYDYDADHANPAGSASAITLPDGTRQHLAYDSERRQVAQTDGEGHTTRYRYGAFDLLEALDGPGDGGLRFGYDTLTRLTAVTNGNGESYRYQYDALGRRIRETDYGGATSHYTYNAAGWLTGETRPDGSRRRYDYDQLSGRLQRIRHWPAEAGDSGSPDLETRLEYDDRGYLKRVDNGEAVIEYERDRFGRLLSERLNDREVSYHYDPVTGLPRGQDAGNQVQWQHDPHGALQRLSIDDHLPLHLTRDQLGRDIQRHSKAGFLLRQDYNALSLLTDQHAGPALDFPADPRTPGPSSRATLAGLPGGGLAMGRNRIPVQRGYEYDRAFNPVRIEDHRWGSTRYGYNASGQVLTTHLGGAGHHAPVDEGFHYDSAHNLIAHTRSNLPGVQSQTVQQQAGRIVRRGQDRYRYDHLGRLVEKTVHRDGFRPQHWRYRWNSDNRLTECITPKGERWRYAYDGLGRRIRKFRVIDGGAPSSNQGQGPGQTDKTAVSVIGEEYLWAGDQLIEAAPLHADGTVAWDQATHWIYEPGGLTPLAQQKGQRLWYIVADQVGTPRELLDEHGELAWANNPRLWGQARLWHRPSANDDRVDCPLRFPGQYHDDESGLHYNRHRYYDPDTAQYLTPDPLGLAGGMRPQGYVENPNAWVDPLGLAGCPNPRRPGGYQVHDVDQHSYLSPGVNRAPGNANIPENNLIQSHHAIQQEWAKINVPGYNPNTAPAILLPSSSKLSHAQISASQRAFRRQYGYNTDIHTEFNEAARQMRTAGVPESQIRRVLKQSYKYFDNLGAFQ